MLTAAFAFGASLLVGALVTPLVRKHAHRVGAVDHALSSRKLHTRPTPRLGGVAIVTAFLLPFIALFFLSPRVMSRFASEWGTTAGFFIGVVGIAGLGVYDDLRGASPKLKFLIQFGVAGLAYAAGFRILSISLPFGLTLPLGWLAAPFTVVFVVGVINAINLIDGLDGLAGGVAVLAGATFFIAAAMRGETTTMWVTAALIGACLGFLIFNFNPASIFMGDTGSMFLGFVLALTAIRSHSSDDGSVSMVAPLLALLVPIGDTLLSMARRALRGVPVFRGDKEHIHHKLLASGLSHRRAVLTVYVATTVLGAAALAVGSGSTRVAFGVLTAVTLLAATALRWLGYFSRARLSDTLAVRQRNLRIRREMAQVAAQLRQANRVDDVWSAVEKAVGVLDARWASVELVLDVDGKRRGLKVAGDPQAPTGLTKSRHGLLAERPEKGFLELAWPVETTPGRDAEIAIETLCVQVREALEGVVERPSMVGELRPRLYTLPPAAAGPRLYSLPPAAVGTRSLSLPPVSVGARRLSLVPSVPSVPSLPALPSVVPSGRKAA